MSPSKLELLKAIKGGHLIERSIHEKFKFTRSHGEWFFPTKELLAFIKN
jgi:hypothetical protein